MLAEHNAALFNTIIPLIYQYLPHATVGNSELLKTTLLVLLPDAVSCVILTRSVYSNILYRWAKSHAVCTLETFVSLVTISTPAFWKQHCHYQPTKPCIIGSCWQQRYRAKRSELSSSSNKIKLLLFSRLNVSFLISFLMHTEH